MRLLDIYKISHSDFTISIGVQYSLSWRDDRLVILGNKSEINLDVDFIKKLWVVTTLCPLQRLTMCLQVPDLYIYDLKSYNNRESIRPQIGVSLKKHADSLGKYSLLVSVTTSQSFFRSHLHP